MKYPIVLYPNPLLTQQTKPVTVITDEIVQLLDDLYETMLAHDGVGLSAPQIGKNLQLAVIQLEEQEPLFELINPEIIERKGEDVDVEGCLSLPDIYGTVKRAQEVTVRYFDRSGEEVEIEAYGYLARVFQHEIDHLQGEIFVDKIMTRIAPEELDAYMEGLSDD